MRILLVEDDPSLADGIATALKREGYAVDLAHSGAQAQTLLRHAEPDLVVLDLDMPGMLGLSGLAALRSAHPSVPVAIVSATTNPAAMRQAIEMGAAGFIPKLAAADRFVVAVREILAGDQPAARAGRDDLLEALLAVELGLGRGDSLLDRAQSKVSARDLRGDADLDVAAVPQCNPAARPSRLDAPAGAAKQVQLPSRVEADTEGRELGARQSESPVVAASAGSGWNGDRILADPLARGRGLRTDLWLRARAGDDFTCSSFANASGRGLDVEVLRDRLVDQSIELGVAEAMPPGNELGLAQTNLRARFRKMLRRWNRGLLVVRTDGCARAEHRRTEKEGLPHLSSPASAVSACCVASALRSSSAPPAG